MNEMSLKQKALMAIAAVVALYIAAAGVWLFYSSADWKKSVKAYRKAKDVYLQEEKLISERVKWNSAYNSEKSLMPIFAQDKETDTTWMQKMDQIASRNHISISQRKVATETDNGEVKELVIEVAGWEGALESMVKFLYELETTGEGMFDISSISFKPAKNGYLKGSFSLTCAYMRE